MDNNWEKLYFQLNDELNGIRQRINTYRQDNNKLYLKYQSLQNENIINKNTCSQEINTIQNEQLQKLTAKDKQLDNCLKEKKLIQSTVDNFNHEIENQKNIYFKENDEIDKKILDNKSQLNSINTLYDDLLETIESFSTNGITDSDIILLQDAINFNYSKQLENNKQKYNKAIELRNRWKEEVWIDSNYGNRMAAGWHHNNFGEFERARSDFDNYINGYAKDVVPDDFRKMYNDYHNCPCLLSMWEQHYCRSSCLEKWYCCSAGSANAHRLLRMLDNNVNKWYNNMNSSQQNLEDQKNKKINDAINKIKSNFNKKINPFKSSYSSNQKEQFSLSNLNTPISSKIKAFIGLNIFSVSISIISIILFIILLILLFRYLNLKKSYKKIIKY